MNSGKEDGQQLETLFSHSERSQMVFSSVVSLANSAARMFFLSLFDMPPLVCEHSLLASFLLCPRDAPVIPRLVFFITIQAERPKEEGFPPAVTLAFAFCFQKGSPPLPVSFSACQLEPGQMPSAKPMVTHPLDPGWK